MPFDDKIANDIYELSTKPVCKEFGLEISYLYFLQKF